MANNKSSFECKRADILKALKIIKVRGSKLMLLIETNIAEKKVALKTSIGETEIPGDNFTGQNCSIYLPFKSFKDYCDITPNDTYTFTVSGDELQLNTTIYRIKH